MSNNTSNYQEYTFSKLLEQYDKILVPMIQRDYAQGRTDKKATDVRKNLLNDIFSGKKVHFDLVFGSVDRIVDGDDKRCFIPVDGQQRLTTLFLLYLYGQKLGKSDTKLDLSKFSYDTRRAASDFCKSITSEEWHYDNKGNVSDAIKDCSWFMDYWAQDPTVEGMLNMLDAIHEKYKQENTFPDLENVTFYFFDLESNGLNENLYLKMNSRGKPLTAFENLKANIEKVLPDNIEIEEKCFPKCDAAPKDSFKEKWKYFMDRDWTESFWDSETPEKFDESITKFIVRFLSGYWEAFGKEEQKIADELKSLNSNDNYIDFIPFEPIKKVLLSGIDAFLKLSYALTTIIDNSKIKPYWSSEKETIKVSDKSEYKSLAVVFTCVLFDGDESAMRFAWNMAENFVKGYDNFVTYCKCTGKIYNKYNKNITFYQALLDIEFDSNTSDQLKEEIAKAKQIINGTSRKDGKRWENVIVEAEKYAFFKGTIRFLFTDGERNINWCDFDTKWEKARIYFSEDGVKDEYKVNAILLRSFISKYSKWGDFWGINYDNEPSTWKMLLTSRFASSHFILYNGIDSVERLISFKASLKEFDNGFEELQNAVQQDLVKTTILVEASKWHSKLNWKYNTYCLYPYNKKAEWKVYVIGSYRNQVLSFLCDNKQIIVEGNRRFESGDSYNFFWGWDISFTYKYDNKEYYFQWHRNGYVRMVGDLDKCEPIVKNDSKDKPEEKWYCLTPTQEMESDPTKFTYALDRLINEADNKKIE